MCLNNIDNKIPSEKPYQTYMHRSSGKLALALHHFQMNHHNDRFLPQQSKVVIDPDHE